jgi:hypothetical protein
MSDEPRDELDHALGAGLGRLGGDAPDADATLAELQPRFRRARTRARVVRASAVALVAIVLGAGAYVFAANGSGKNRVSVAASTTTGSAHRSTTSLQRRSTTTTTAPAPSTTPTTAPTSPRTMITVPFGGGNQGPPPTAPALPTTTTPPSNGENHTYHADGGTMTVRFANGQLTLVSYQASDGWVAAVHTNTPDDIEVRFSKGGDDSRIRVRVENGRPVQVDE